MNIINHVLIPIDFSNSSLAALKYARGMSKGDRKISITLLHVSRDGLNIQGTKEKMKGLKESYFDVNGTSCAIYVTTGKFLDELGDIVQHLNIDLIITGTSGIQTNETNTNSAEIPAKVECPIWIVPEGFTEFKLDNIALALDEKQLDNASTLKFFHDIAKWHNAKVHLLKVNRKSTIEQKIGLNKEETLDYYLESLDYHYSFTYNSDIVAGIESYIQNHAVDALAIITRNKTKNMQPSDGKLTKELAKHSKTPLLIFF